MTLRVQTARGVGDDCRVAASDRCVHRVEDNRRGVTIGFSRNDRDAHALGPALQLLDRRGAEGVGRGEERTLSRILQSLRQFRGGRRLATAVHADDEDHARILAIAAEPDIAGERGNERLADRGKRLRDRFQLTRREEIAQLGHERIHERNGKIGAKQSLLERVEPFGGERLFPAPE